MFTTPKARQSLRLLVLILNLAAYTVSAQSLSGLLSSGSTSTAASSPAADRLGRSTPKSSIYNFLEACHQDRFVLAAEYLDLRRLPSNERVTEGPQLARELADLLDRDPKFELARLSDNPEGHTGDGLTSDRDNLVDLEVNGVTVTLEMQRVTQQGLSVWLVSQDSVARLPELDSLAGESAIEKKLPAVLVETKLLGTPLWVWIALVGIALIISLLSRLLSRLFLAVLTPLAKRYAKWLHAYRLEAFVEPLRLLLSVVVFRALMEVAAPSALLRDYLLKLLTLLFALGAAALTMRVVDVISDQILTRLNSRERALSYSVLPLGVRFVKICIFCLAVLFTLTSWGYNTNAILAGLGVGGLAVALAAQKTIENLFGGISLITDRPVLVGDLCQFGGQMGTVEDIGLRSTRIRTNDRTLVTIPNSSFSTMTLENYSRRDRMWFHPTIRLRRDTTPEQIREMMDAMTKILQEHPKVDAAGLPLRFTKIGDQAFDLEIFAYVNTDDGNEFLKVQNELLLQFLQAGVDRGVGFAVPMTETLNITPPANQQGVWNFHPAAALPEERQPPG